MTKKNALISGLVFAALMSVYYSYQKGNIISGILMGIIGGVLFALFTYFIYNSTWFKGKIDVKNDNEEPVIYNDGANHFLNGEGVGGKLYLMKDKLKFISHRFNLQNHQLLMDLHDIKQIGFWNIAGIIPTGIEIEMNNGKTEKFVVNKRQKWMEEIRSVKEGI
jgi:hypothetical protein